jgi:glutathione S-transferase
MELPEVAGSVTADFPDRLRNYISERGSLFLRSA